MFDLRKLPAKEQQAIYDEVAKRYLEGDGADIDLAIKRHRRTLKEHDREMEHVSKMDFDKPYRWRVAPGIALRAEKALELQKSKRAALMHEIYADILRERGLLDKARPAAKPAKDMPSADQIEELTSQFAEAMKEYKEWRSGGQEASPPASSAA